MLIEDIKAYQLILASGSPRRKELLTAAGFIYQVAPAYHTDESYPAGLQGPEIPAYLAEKKSAAYPGKLKDTEILITADTIVWQNGAVLHKPSTEEEARQTLQHLANSSHAVYTGVCLRSARKTTTFVSGTEVRFGFLSEKEINYYIQNFKPFDKAGAYGIQEWIGCVGVEEIHGSYFNVMGLPVHQLYRQLEIFIQKTDL